VPLLPVKPKAAPKRAPARPPHELDGEELGRRDYGQDGRRVAVLDPRDSTGGAGHRIRRRAARASLCT
jgi:hypothetical protein